MYEETMNDFLANESKKKKKAQKMTSAAWTMKRAFAVQFYQQGLRNWKGRISD